MSQILLNLKDKSGGWGCEHESHRAPQKAVVSTAGMRHEGEGPGNMSANAHPSLTAQADTRDREKLTIIEGATYIYSLT